MYAAVFLLTLASLPSAGRADLALDDNDVVMAAMVDELQRSMAELVLADLARPYLIQCRAEDRVTLTMEAYYGGMHRSNVQRSRVYEGRVRVGSFELDNTNFPGSFGSRAFLPLDDDYTAIRHAIWWAADADYKHAVEMLTRKRAHLEDKIVEDRPDDYLPGETVVLIEPSAELAFDRKEWEGNVARLSARFKEHRRVQNSSVSLYAGVVNDHVVSSEGTRLRTADTGVHIRISAELQAEEGMRLRDGLEYLAEHAEQLPSIEEMLADIDEMCVNLTKLADAEIMDHYMGPVLFEPGAAGRLFHALLSEGICARPVAVGMAASDKSLERRLGLRILPRSFQVYDDPRRDSFEGKLLAGHYDYDDEAVAAQRVDVVVDGKLHSLLASRSPTKKVKGSTGHGRVIGAGDAQATVACLFISDDGGVDREELKTELLEAARDEGLDYALRVEKIEAHGRGSIGAPVFAYKVYVEDGREELVRGLEFLPVRTRVLKRIVAAGDEREVYNSTSPVVSSIVAPAVIIEELELAKLKEEFDKKPILQPPSARAIEQSSPQP